jgi:hypothetical protein
MQKWEYYKLRSAVVPEVKEEWLNGLGEQGWELIIAIPADDGFDVVFKRPLEEKAKTQKPGFLAV